MISTRNILNKLKLLKHLFKNKENVLYKSIYGQIRSGNLQFSFIRCLVINYLKRYNTNWLNQLFCKVRFHACAGGAGVSRLKDVPASTQNKFKTLILLKTFV